MLRSRILKLGTLLAAVFVAGLFSGSASATLALNQAAALVAVPILVDDMNGGNQWSYAVVTNASSQNVTLHLEFLDGRNWNGLDYSCPVTGEETILFVFRPDGNGGTAVDFKCSFAFPTPNGIVVGDTPYTLVLPFETGLMTVAVESPAGTTVSQNILFADWLAVDFDTDDAFIAGAITFQGLSALAQDGDRNYQFDGKEYSTFPAQLASNFLAPTSDSYITTFLILFTLDATVNGQPVAPGGQVDPVQLRGNVYNDRENSQSFNYFFDCFQIVSLETISPAFLNTLDWGSFMTTMGHFDLTPVATGAGDPAHEFAFGNGDHARKRPALGWIVEHIRDSARIPGVVDPNSIHQISPELTFSSNSRARTLGTSVTSFTPLTGDTPTFSSN